jgi:hypothetical protein
LAALASVAHRHRAWRLGFCIISIAWLLLVGAGGAFGAYGWLLTDHWAAAYNENLLHLNPVALVLAMLVPMAAIGRPRAVRAAICLAFFMFGAALLGALLKMLPWFIQYNWDIISLALPAHIGLALGLWTINRRRRQRADVASDRPARRHPQPPARAG